MIQYYEAYSQSCGSLFTQRVCVFPCPKPQVGFFEKTVFKNYTVFRRCLGTLKKTLEPRIGSSEILSKVGVTNLSWLFMDTMGVEPWPSGAPPGIGA